MGLLSHLPCFTNISHSSGTRTSSDQTTVSTKQPSNIIEELCHRFSLKEIQSATNNFNESLIIGKSRLAKIYKGYLQKSGNPVAIKRLSKGSSYEPYECENEVVMLCQLHDHRNIITLIGFCIERDEHIIVHDYMPNGSLHDHIHHTTVADPLPWKRRLQICIGVARGLHYLHTGLKYAIIHRDIKTQNILLDENWEPRVADFSLSKRGALSISRKLTRVESRVAGTFGYLDPEYFATSVLTEKSDVFSFGVVLIEVLSAQKAVNFSGKSPIDNLRLPGFDAKRIVDPFLQSKVAPDCLKTFIGITERCLLIDGNERPDMGEVEVELEHALHLQEEADANSNSHSL